MFSRLLNSVLFVFVCSSFIVLSGCQKAEQKPEPKTEPATAPATSPAPEAKTEAKAEPAKAENPNFPPFHSHTVGRKGGPVAILGQHQFHVEFLPNTETGDITALVYDNEFMPLPMEAKELTLDIMVGGEPKKYTFLVNDAGSASTVADYKLSDVDLAKLLKDGWDGNAQVSITEKGSPASGKLYNPKK